MRFFEDFAPGDVFDLGRQRMHREDMLAFAAQWDPQPFHLDEVAAAHSTFGGLIASGWHTACVIMRRYVDQLIADAASMGSPGLSELRWRHPVRPGDELDITAEVLEVHPSATRPDRGTVILHWRAVNQDGTVVATMTGRGLFGRRPTTGR